MTLRRECKRCLRSSPGQFSLRTHILMMMVSLAVVAVAVIVVLILMVRFCYMWQSGRCKSNSSLIGKTVIITGSSAGIGRATAKDLASRGARVIMACRNLTKANKVAGEIIEATGNQQVIVRQIDTSDLTSVREFAQEILANEKHLHVLINNAGIGGGKTQTITADGLDYAMAANYYGHFLLTLLLLGLLKASAPSRVVNLSSCAHIFCVNLDPNDLTFANKPYNYFATYAQSKLCNMLFTIELAGRLKGTGVTTNSVHPGAVSTEIFGKGGSLLGYYTGFLVRLFAKSPNLGAQTVIYLAVAEEVKDVSGKYFVDCKEAQSSEQARDLVLARKLWEVTEKDVKLQPEEAAALHSC